MNRPSRRYWLAGSAPATLSCLRQPIVQTSVSILKAASYRADLLEILRRGIAQHPLDIRGKRIVLKPNIVEFDAETPINTNPLFVHAVVELFRSLGAHSVRIAEGPGHRRTTLDLADSAGYFSSISGFESLFTDLNLDEISLVKLANPFSKLHELYLPRTVLDCDLLVSLPKLKTHHWVGATLSMKNFFGTVPGGVYGWPKNVLHWAGINECIADLYRIYPRTFAIVDGIDAMEGNGPIQGSLRHAGVIVMGHDLVAVDSTCCRVMSIDPAKIGYLSLVSRGQTNENNVKQLAESISSVRGNFSLLPHFEGIRLGT